MTNLVFNQGQVTAAFKIFDVVNTDQYWGRDISNYTLTELNYNEATGRHDIRIDYSLAAPQQDAGVARFVGSRAEITAQDTTNDLIDVAVWRGDPNHDPSPRDLVRGDDIFELLKDQITRRFNKRMARSRYRFTEASVDQVAGPPHNGFRTVTRGQLNNALVDVTTL